MRQAQQRVTGQFLTVGGRPPGIDFSVPAWKLPPSSVPTSMIGAAVRALAHAARVRTH